MVEWFRALGTGFKARVQGPHPANSGICFSVVQISNPQSRFVNSQLVCLLPGGIFNYVRKFLFPLFQWHVCILQDKPRAKCITTITKIYIHIFVLQVEITKKDKHRTVRRWLRPLNKDGRLTQVTNTTFV